MCHGSRLTFLKSHPKTLPAIPKWKLTIPNIAILLDLFLFFCCLFVCTARNQQSGFQVFSFLWKAKKMSHLTYQNLTFIHLLLSILYMILHSPIPYFYCSQNGISLSPWCVSIIIVGIIFQQCGPCGLSGFKEHIKGYNYKDILEQNQIKRAQDLREIALLHCLVLVRFDYTQHCSVTLFTTVSWSSWWACTKLPWHHV